MSLRHSTCFGVLLGLVFYVALSFETSAQTRRIDAAAPGLLEAGIPLFTIRSQDALGLDSAPADMHLMPDGRILVYGGKKIALGDGTRWEVFRLAANSPPITGEMVTVDKDGAIYVGMRGDFARVEFSGMAEWRGHPMNVLPAAKRSSAPVFFFVNDADGEWFWHSGSGSLTRWKPGREPCVMGYAVSNNHMFRLDGSFYLSDGTTGQLWLLSEKNAESVAYSDSITPQDAIFCSTPFGPHAMLVGVSDGGLKLFDGERLLPFKGSDVLTGSAKVNSLCRTEGGFFAAAVENVGIVFFDKEGAIVQILDRSIDNRLWRIKKLLPAAGGIIWGLLDDGIVRVEFPSRLSYFERLVNVGISTTNVHRFDGKLWFRANGRILRGIYSAQGRLTGFEVDSPRDWRAFSFSGAMGMPVIGSDRGGFYRDDAGWHSFAPSTVNLCILHSQPIEGRWLYAAKGEIGWLKPIQGGFDIESHPAPELDKAYISDGDKDGSVWLELGNGSIGRVRISNGVPQFEKFGISDGLLVGWVHVFSIDGNIRFNIPSNTILRFDEVKQRFEPDTDFMRRLPNLKDIEGRPSLDSKGRLWITASQTVRVLARKDGILSDSGEKMIPGFNPFLFTSEANGVVWMHHNGRLIRYDPSMPSIPKLPLRAMVSSICLPSSGRIFPPGDESLRALPYSDNSLLVHYAATGGSLSSSTSFEVMLEGGAKNWDEAGSAGSTAFNRLKEGSYVLHVRPKSGSFTGTEAAIPFTILPPWYRTKWAYFMYLAVGVGSILSVLKIASILQRREKVRLERLVNQRTSELNETNARLAIQIEEVRRLSQAVEQSPVGVLLTKPDETIAYANPCYCAMCGYSREELMDRNINTLRSDIVPKAVIDQISATLAAEESWNGTLAHRHKDGRIVHTRATLSPIRGPEGNVLSLLVLEEDITEWLADQERQRRLEAQLFQARKMKSLGTLAGGIAHDFNNILTGILGYCELASLTPDLDPDLKEALMEIRNGGLRARDLVAQILTFSRKSYVKLEPLDLSVAIAEAL
ncbi:MAG: PAS domain S-box protein, partial [Opitutaceae bacterium]